MVAHWLAELDGRRVIVEVPASSANLGAGFDCVGMAVDRYLDASYEPGPGPLQVLRPEGAPSGDDLVAISFGEATTTPGEVVFGRRLKSRLPAKRVPDAVERWIRMYEAEREEGEVFNDFAERAGQTRFEDEVRDLSMPVEFGLENMQYFIDWQRKEPFQVIRGEGECAV